MATAKTKTKVIRPLLLQVMGEKKETITSLSFKLGIDRSMLDCLINCKRDGSIEIWKKIQETLEAEKEAAMQARKKKIAVLAEQFKNDPVKIALLNKAAQDLAILG